MPPRLMHLWGTVGMVTIFVLVALLSPIHRMEPLELIYNNHFVENEQLLAMTFTLAQQEKDKAPTTSTPTTSTATTSSNVLQATTTATSIHRNETALSLASHDNYTNTATSSSTSSQTANTADSTTKTTTAITTHNETALKKQTTKIVQISLLGERNSGTNWMSSHLQKCFGHALTIRTGLNRFKHWFQYEDTSLDEALYGSTLVLAQFRNPYQWLMAMMHVPHHMPEHHLDDLHNDWKLFLTKQWTMPRIGKDLQLMQQYPHNYSNILCHERFLFRDLVTCIKEPVKWKDKKKKPFYSEHVPFYEMRNDGSGVPYNNIMELRSDKIINFLSVAQYNQVAELWTVQYEDLLEQGTGAILQRIATRTGVTAKCKPHPPQPRRPASPSRTITPEFVQFIRTRLNWTTETMIGYSPTFCLDNATCI